VVAYQFSSISLTLTFWGLLCTYLLSPKLCLKYKSGCLPTTRQPYNKWKCPESPGSLQ
jgi:hypothetical protein